MRRLAGWRARRSTIRPRTGADPLPCRRCAKLLALMKRPLLILILALLAGGALFASSYFMSRRVCESCSSSSTDKLDWLRQEFHLSDADIARMHELHDGYLPKCGEMCAQIAAKKQELDTALVGAT